MTKVKYIRENNKYNWIKSSYSKTQTGAQKHNVISFAEVKQNQRQNVKRGKNIWSKCKCNINSPCIAISIWVSDKMKFKQNHSEGQ